MKRGFALFLAVCLFDCYLKNRCLIFASAQCSDSVKSKASAISIYSLSKSASKSISELPFLSTGTMDFKPPMEIQDHAQADFLTGIPSRHFLLSQAQ